MSSRLGRETVQFIIGQQQELFTVHTELICTSKYFRNIIQQRRKAIVEGEECSICHEALDPGVKELIFCFKSCGTNFHRSCLDDWKWGGPKGPLHCPMCRSLWGKPQVAIYRLLTLDAEAFEIYINWLYTTSISVPSHDHEFEVAFPRLLKAFDLADKIHEPVFSKAILSSLLPVCTKKSRPSIDTVVDTYAITPGSTPMRKLLILLHMELSDQEYNGVLASWDKYPVRFQKDLTKAMMRERAKGVGTRDLDEPNKKLGEDDEWDLAKEEE